MSIQEQIENLRKVRIDDPYNFRCYLRELYNDLSNRVKNKISQINKLIFLQYLNINFFIGEKLFYCFNKKKSETMGIHNFLQGLIMLFAGSSEEVSRIIFGMYDFGSKGYLRKEDVLLLLSHIPKEYSLFPHKDENSHITLVVNKLFRNWEYLNLHNFSQSIQKEDSCVLIMILRYLFAITPFNYENINKFNCFNHIKKTSIPFSNNNYFRFNVESHESTDESDNSETSDCDEQISINLPKIIQYKKLRTSEIGILFPNKTCRESVSSIKHEDYIHKFTENGEFKQFWMALNDRELYYYKDKKNENIKLMQSLSGCFVKKNGTMIINNIKYYCFSITCLTKTSLFYTIDKESTIKWVHNIRKSLNYRCIFDHYDIHEGIEEGKLGNFKTGIDKKSKQKVAIKIIKKKDHQSILSAYSEIDTLKTCSNKYIVKYIDQFETAKLIFIITEYISGRTLEEYISKKNLGEQAAREIIFKIAKGVNYLHNLGIIHRDINPNKIIINEINDKICLKIIDFSSSKIIGKEEKSDEMTANYLYSAPEIFRKIPYDCKVDVWAMGVMIFYIFTKSYPFQSEINKFGYLREIVRNDFHINFKQNYWYSKSSEVVNLITLCLNNVNERLNMRQFLNHSWFEKCRKLVQ
jgi:hypothetical protein